MGNTGALYEVLYIQYALQMNKPSRQIRMAKSQETARVKKREARERGGEQMVRVRRQKRQGSSPGVVTT